MKIEQMLRGRDPRAPVNDWLAAYVGSGCVLLSRISDRSPVESRKTSWKRGTATSAQSEDPR